MPISTTYPGVYIEEIPSGVRTITGVSTSDTAFVDFFERGPVDKAVRITSFADFERQFGGLDTRSEASYAIQQFYRNGGSVAWVVRVASPSAKQADRTLLCSASYYGYASGGSGGSGNGSLLVKAASPGKWGNNIQVGVDYKGTKRDTLSQPAEFNLVVREVVDRGGKSVVVASEIYRNLSMDKTSSRFVEGVINKNSAMVRVEAISAGELPEKTHEDAIGAINDAKDNAFLKLGADDGQAGFDGVLPDSDEWKQSDGANALLGKADEDETRWNAGIYELERIAPFVFNILCLPAAANLSDDSLGTVLAEVITFCEKRRAFLIVDTPEDVNTDAEMVTWMSDHDTLRSSYAAVYFPRLQIADPLNENRPRNVGASGTMAGIYARTDSARGVWKAPAGTDAALRGAELVTQLTDLENGGLNQLGINVMRNFPVFGNVAWGGRTLDGADQKASEWKYIPVRRTALYIEESLYQSLKWVVFEPNDEPLWAQIRLNVGAFMHDIFRQGGFQGKTPREAYFVKCDKETTTQTDINLGIVNIVVGFAPLKPAEFVIIKIQQIAGQVQA